MIWRKMEGLASGIAILRARRSNFASAASSYSRRRQGQEQGDVFLSLNNSSPFSTTTECDYKPPLATSRRIGIVPATIVDDFYAYIKYPAQVGSALAERCKLWSDNPADSVSLFDRMVEIHPLVSRVVDFNRLFTILARMKRYSTAIYLIKRMRVLGTVPIDQTTLNILLNCFCRLDRVHYAYSIVGTFLKFGYAPHQHAFTVLMNGLVGENKITEALEIFNMLSRGRSFMEFECTTQATVLNALFKAGNISKATWLLNKMEHRPYQMIIDTVIDGFCLCGLVDSALDYSKMGGFTNVGTYNSFIRGFAKLGRWDDVRRILRAMQRRDIQPDAYTYYVLIDVLGNERRYQVYDMLRYVSEGLSYPGPTSLAVCYPRGCLEVDEYYVAGYPVEAILKVMSYVDADVVAYNSLMKRYCLDGHMDKALQVFNYLVKNMGLRANIFSYNILINGYCSRMELDEALKLYRDIALDAGLRPNSETNNTILSGLLTEGRCAEAEDVFREMINQGVAPDISTYSTLLNNLCNNKGSTGTGELWCKWLKPDFCQEKIINKAENLLLEEADNDYKEAEFAEGIRQWRALGDPTRSWLGYGFNMAL